uniref:proline--tRNA ligase n=1 Tax=Ditylenchus dipsaci TaxID=166011 RepID=A0A915DDV6_9BILA
MVLNLASRMFMNLRSGSKKSICPSYQLMIDNNLMFHADKGLFAMLPLGQRVVDKLLRLVERELLAIGAHKLEMPMLAPKHLWTKTDRWNAMGQELFRLTDRTGQEFCLQPTAEEMMTSIASGYGRQKQSAFPMMFFQCSHKFRDEKSPKFALLRSRQFLMNDLYSFDLDQESAENTYRVITDVYEKILRDILKLPNVYRIQADSGTIGGKISHEYHVPSPSHADMVQLCRGCQHAYASSKLICDRCGGENTCVDSVEVAHTFQLDSKYSEVFEAVSTSKVPYSMCCFGIGITRLIAACVDELSVSEKAMRLPYTISPFKLAVVMPKDPKDAKWQFTEQMLQQLDMIPSLTDQIFVDDRCNKNVGFRLAELNALGVPHILVSNSRKSDDPFGIFDLEYFRTSPCSDVLQESGR